MEQQDVGAGRNMEFKGQHFGEDDADRVNRLALVAERNALRADLLKHKAHIRELGDIITNQCIAMQSALIEQSIGGGNEAALVWISNTLRGPGLLPDMSGAAHLPARDAVGPAQAWFNTKMAAHEALRAKQAAAVGAG